MSIIQIQKKKTLTLADISPKWWGVIKYGWPEGKCMSLNDMRYCVVGEAHKGDSSYGFEEHEKYCARCDRLGYLFFGAAKGDLSEIADRFVEHWNEVHVK